MRTTGWKADAWTGRQEKQSSGLFGLTCTDFPFTIRSAEGEQAFSKSTQSQIIWNAYLCITAGEKKKETERLSLLRLNHSPTSWQNSITSKKGMLSLHCPRHWRMFGCLRLLQRGRKTKKKSPDTVQHRKEAILLWFLSSIWINTYVFSFSCSINTLISVTLLEGQHCLQQCCRFHASSYLYGSDSAKNFLCSSGLALTRSSFTTAWEELQSHNTSARITWHRSTDTVKENPWRTLWDNTVSWLNLELFKKKDDRGQRREEEEGMCVTFPNQPFPISWR